MHLRIAHDLAGCPVHVAPNLVGLPGEDHLGGLSVFVHVDTGDVRQHHVVHLENVSDEEGEAGASCLAGLDVYLSETPLRDRAADKRGVRRVSSRGELRLGADCDLQQLGSAAADAVHAALALVQNWEDEHGGCSISRPRRGHDQADGCYRHEHGEH